jgi:uncharacterized protein with NAD-binding domain and iron-sulfur cluster
VTVYGAGVTGLTVAHELATRGFNVFVVEPVEDPTSPERRCAVGGMARTQWSSIPFPFKIQRPVGTMIPTRPIVPLRWRVRFRRGETELALDEPTRTTLAEVARTLREHPWLSLVYVEGFAYDEGAAHDEMATAEARANSVRDHLVNLGIARDRLLALGLGHAFPEDRSMLPEERRYVGFRAREIRIPGEHGYRFFPSFYRHLFDTMKRTPILERKRVSDYEFNHDRAVLLNISKALREEGAIVEPSLSEERIGHEYLATRFTTYDNLVPLPQHALARAGDDEEPIVLDRRRAFSFETLRTMTNAMLGDMGFRAADIALFILKLFKFQTSCMARRDEEYNGISWMDFIEGHRYSEGFRSAMEKWPYSLIALSATECDAKTHGIITTQLILDQIKLGFTDGTLNGPTNPAWLDHWRLYLEQKHMVRFYLGELLGFDWDGKNVVPRQRSYRADASVSTDPPFPGYYVVCLPLERMKGLFTEALLEAIDEQIQHRPPETRRNDVRRLAEYALAEQALFASDRKGSLRHFTGVQFYFEQDVNWVSGHTYYPDSVWGLSSISQTPFRMHKTDWRDGYRGLISVDIGVMDQRGSNGRTAWDCDRHEIAAEVWKQIKDGAESNNFRLPDPVYYHVDENLVFYDVVSGRVGVRENRSPFLIPKVGTWEARPGEPDDYHVYLDCLVLAGTYMKTYTRLTTMEAANESARHAVNAILKHYASANEDARIGTPCDIWPIDNYEFEDLKLFKALDEKLFSIKDEKGKRLPHFVDILELEALPTSILVNLWGANAPSGGDPIIALFHRIRAIASGAASGSVVDLLRIVLDRVSERI